jgi:hypothetical protein
MKKDVCSIRLLIIAKFTILQAPKSKKQGRFRIVSQEFIAKCRDYEEAL